MDQQSFNDCWNNKSLHLTKSKLRSAEIQHTMRQWQNYTDVFGEQSSSEENTNETQYISCESTPSTSSSGEEDEGETKQ